MNILAIDSNRNNLQAIENQVKKDRNNLFIASEAAQGISYLETEDIDVVITNKFLADGDGFDIMRMALAQTPPSPVVIISHQNTVDAMIEALQLGALDYIPDPIDTKVLKIALHRAYERRQMHLSAAIEPVQDAEPTVGFLQGSSDAMQYVFDQIRHSAPFKTTVLITGESGTGKDLVARSIHALSPRAQGPFIAINCSAIPRELVESHLFGHEKGAFTSAMARQEGVFEAATGGTLFLDEIGDLAPEAQAKLLRVLEEKQITRLGSTSTVDVDVRLVAATNSNLELAIQEGRFREDLYYRLNVLHIEMPPLRERPKDVPLLVTVFLDRFAQENGMSHKNITDEALEKLTAYNWPGNVRELKNITERLAVNAQSDTIEATHLPPQFQNIVPEPEPSSNFDLTPLVGIPLESIEKMLIDITLQNTHGNRTRAARLLGISLRTLQRKLKEYGQEEMVV
ncbi:MAG: DNA-binding NtrC family response regulator [Candidatus Latescibacterota bacterium]|jgi:DNA-binding NtrC family response regulator